MKATDGSLAQWLRHAQITEDRLTAEQRGLLQGAFAFRQRCGQDYYSSRLLSHFLLNSDAGLKVAQIARLVGFSRPTASRQQGVSSKETVQAAHQRMAGRPHGKLLPRYAGPIAEFILTHTDATRYDILDFIERTWGVHVSTVALHHFCKKFGLDRATRAAATAPQANVTPPSAARTSAAPATAPKSTKATATRSSAPKPRTPKSTTPTATATPANASSTRAERLPAAPPPLVTVPPRQPVPLPPPPFCRRGRNTRAPSS